MGKGFDKVVNVKLDNETKSKMDTLAYLQGGSLQDLCISAIEEYISKYDKDIAEAEQLRNKFKK